MRGEDAGRSRTRAKGACWRPARTVQPGHVAVEIRVPCPGGDLPPDELAVLGELLGRSAAEPALLVQLEKAIEGSPAKHTGMGVVTRTCSGFPQALVRHLPVATHVLAKVTEHSLRLPIKGTSSSSELGGGVDHFAVDVELGLLGRGVANTDRSGSPVTRQMVQGPFSGGTLAVNVIENPQLRPGQAGGVQQPAHERLGLRREAQPEQRAHRQPRVAPSAEAVVPVQVPTHPFGQRRRGSRHDRTRRRKDEQLEHESASNDRLPRHAVVRQPRDPSSPPCHRTVDGLRAPCSEWGGRHLANRRRRSGRSGKTLRPAASRWFAPFHPAGLRRAYPSVEAEDASPTPRAFPVHRHRGGAACGRRRQGAARRASPIRPLPPHRSRPAGFHGPVRGSGASPPRRRPASSPSIGPSPSPSGMSSAGRWSDRDSADRSGRALQVRS
jgi:hypothetical protein